MKTEERKGLFGIFENRRKRGRIQHTDNGQEQDQDMDRGAYGYAVAEETNYEGDEIGKTVYMEDIPQESVRIRRLYTPEGELNATNGTFKNGLRMQPYEKRKLEPGDEIKCGRVILIFR